TAEDATTQDWTVTISLAQLDVAGIPFECDFEDVSENGNWVFENDGQTNQWHIGAAANNGGANGLYISDNNGVSYNYNTSSASYVYAFRQINFAEAGHYDISFDWKARGESGCYDAMYAALVPQGTTCPPASNIISYNNTLPTGYINVADVSQSYSTTGAFLWTYNESAWITSTKNIEITESGDYTLVFYWKNDGSGGTNPPAAVDNISIARSVFTVTASHTGLGTISPEGQIVANDGEEIQFSVTPMDGFIISTLMVDGVDHAEEIVDGIYTLTVTGNHNVVANFDVPHTILASAGVGGTITPEGSVQVGNGESKTFAIASNAGYIISSVIADTLELISEGQELVNFSYTFNNVRDDHTITATFEVAPSHTILATAGEGGTINPSGTITVLYNGSQTFEFTPNEGYRLSRVMVDTTSNVTTFVENNTYTFNNVIANHSINAEFVANSYNLTVHYVYADNTTAAPDHTESVTFGTAYSVTSPVIPGYTTEQLVVEGTMPAQDVVVTVTYNVNYYTLTINYVNADNDVVSPAYTNQVAYGAEYSVESPVIPHYTASQTVVSGTMPAEDVTVTVTYTAITYTITASAGNGGTITPDGAVTVDEGTDKTFAIAASTGYHIADVLVDGQSVGALASYTFPNVMSDHTIEATFEADAPNTYTITASAGNGGTITPNGAVTVEEGIDKTFAIAASTGYHIADVLVDGQSVGAVVSYTFQNVNANHTIEATFEADATPNTYTITATAGNGGTITPNGTITVNEGADQSFTITPNAGYRIASVLVDNADATSQLVNGVYTFTNVRANHTIVATFEPASSTTYTITASAGNGGTITPNNVVTVAEGANQTFRFTPDNGFRIATVVVDGNNVMDEVVDYSYTFYDVRANHTIYVTFTDGDAVDEYTTSSMSVYPNPNNGMFSIDFSRIEGDATYQLIDARGAVVETRDINVMDGDTLNFNHDLRPGTYFVRIVTADKVYVEQIVVE
ncbi:MAG: MucBP domain-containing protein, partial [Bacteroidales bacterium]|nr:MucBP domain-containing protein [Bacteroidales bacterium]